VRIALLGPVELSEGDRRIRLTGSKQHALVTLLALNAGRLLPVDRLVDALWGDAEPRDGVNALQHQVSRLREAVGRERVTWQGSGYVLEVPEDAVDVRRFEQLAVDGRAALRREDAGAAVAALRSALGLWRGPPLDGLPAQPWVLAEVTRLEHLRLDVVEDRIEAELALGLHVELAGELQALVGEHRFRERLWGQLMVALYRSGRQADALEAYRAAGHALADGHGLDPGPELQRLQAAILAHDPALAPSVAARSQVPAAAAPPERAPGNLPALLTSFIGRHEQLPAVRSLLRSCRLLTLTGPPGVGKTRLAIELGRAMRGEFPDGVWLVELAALSDPDDVVAAVGAALALREPGRPVTAAGAVVASARDGVELHLRDRRMLLVLDNCEHLVAGVAGLVDPLLAACPELHVLATSREALAVRGEALWPVPPLTLPAAGIRDPRELLASEAVRLFEDRAVRALPSFAITPETAPAVATLCRHLDGLPLAIELAAARVRALPVGHIAASLDDRFRLLVGRSRTAPARQQTLRATLDWSYDLLDAKERAAFQQLSVFAGGCSLEAAGFVAGRAGVGGDELVDLVSGLVDKSMVTAEPDAAGGPRYGTLESLRIYGLERLAEQGGLEQARRVHREYFLGFAEAAEEGLRHADYRAWQRRVTHDYDNLRSAFDGALADGDLATALRLASALWLYWAAADRHSEGSAWLEAALEAWSEASSEGVPPAVRAAGFTVLSYLAGQQHDVARAVQAGERAVALAAEAGDDWELARATQTLALVLGAAGQPERAAGLLAEARAAMEATGDDFWVAASDLITAASAIRAGRLDLVERTSRQVLAGAQRIGYEPFECWARLLLGAVAERRSDPVAAVDELDQALAVARRLGLPHYAAFVLGELGRLTMLAGDLERAQALLTEAVRTAQAADSPWFAALAQTQLAATLRRSGGVAEAEALLTEVRAWAEQPDARQTRATFFITLGGSPYARSLVGLGALRAATGDLGGAERLLLAGLDRAELEHDHPAVAGALEELAAAAAAASQAERAAVLLGAATAHRATTAHPQHPAARQQVERTTDAARSLLGAAALDAAMTRGRRLPRHQALAFAHR
jgi:predicted ATPase/DNA-binding SARP family transcriptional activator